MRAKKIQKIKVFKFIDCNNNSKITDNIQETINKFINSDEVESIIDIKVNTQLENLFVKTGNSYHCSGTTNISIYYTILYYPM